MYSTGMESTLKKSGSINPDRLKNTVKYIIMPGNDAELHLRIKVRLFTFENINGMRQAVLKESTGTGAYLYIERITKKNRRMARWLRKVINNILLGVHYMGYSDTLGESWYKDVSGRFPKSVSEIIESFPER